MDRRCGGAGSTSSSSWVSLVGLLEVARDEVDAPPPGVWALELLFEDDFDDDAESIKGY